MSKSESSSKGSSNPTVIIVLGQSNGNTSVFSPYDFEINDSVK
jgi:hypothetical protein